MDIGRRQNADPRWILPLLCRRGHITRNEIGAIRIGPQETHFQIPRAIADKFGKALGRTAGDEGNGGDVHIELSPEAPRDAARARKKGPQGAGKKGAQFVKKHRKGNSDRPAQRGDKPAKHAKAGGKRKPRTS